MRPKRSARETEGLEGFMGIALPPTVGMKDREKGMDERTNTNSAGSSQKGELAEHLSVCNMCSRGHVVRRPGGACSAPNRLHEDLKKSLSPTCPSLSSVLFPLN